MVKFELSALNIYSVLLNFISSVSTVHWVSVLPNVMAEWLALLLHVWEVLGSNLSRETVFRDFVSSCRKMLGWYLKLGHTRFLPYHFWCIIIPSVNHKQMHYISISGTFWDMYYFYVLYFSKSNLPYFVRSLKQFDSHVWLYWTESNSLHPLMSIFSFNMWQTSRTFFFGSFISLCFLIYCSFKIVVLNLTLSSKVIFLNVRLNPTENLKGLFMFSGCTIGLSNNTFFNGLYIIYFNFLHRYARRTFNQKVNICGLELHGVHLLCNSLCWW